ncbi:MAG TPA: 5'-3' exonuclease H3TH domain-containing protein [Candidatus Dormibacteraeota bacterium]|nr:5'-3' exonuclease H3TH domain-containing protein [Candidatus Dormibacteraeota bacterium]HVC23019.1 5'-3' exonuclease H3TH domain-containing protein [Candidatus Dormibacteraeota bacterium]
MATSPRAKHSPAGGVRVHLVDGTYELFRQHHGLPEELRARPRAAVRAVVEGTIALLESGATHVGVATDHVVESFRNGLWPAYKSSVGMDPAILAQFGPLEEALAELGVALWAMTELEADDALASAAAVAGDDPAVEQVLILTADKDLAQAVRGERVVQLDRRHGRIIDHDGVVEKFGVEPTSIPDLLALVGDQADGFPGLPGWGARSASVVLARFRYIGDIPPDQASWGVSVRGAQRLAVVLRENGDLARLFLDLATLRVERQLLPSVVGLRWTGPGPGLARLAEAWGARSLMDRVAKLAAVR